MRLRNALGSVVVGLGLLLVGCVKKEATGSDAEVGARRSVFVPGQDVTLAKQVYSGYTTRTRTVIRSAAEWTSVWAQIHGAEQPPPGVVQPDFTSEMAVVAAMGEKASGGFDIAIDSVTVHERGVIVYVTETSPGSNCMTTGALTHPVHAVRAPRTIGTTLWREKSVTQAC